MAVIANLKEKVEKAQVKVQKCKGTIERHEKQLQKKTDALEKKGINTRHLDIAKIENRENNDIYWDIIEVIRKQDDIKGAEKKLKEAERVLNNWQEKLDLEIEKERFLNDNAPEVIKTFLQNWKQMAYDWHVKRYGDYKVFSKKLNEEVQETMKEYIKLNKDVYSRYLDENGEIEDFCKNNLINVRPRKPMEEYLKEKNLDWKSVKQRKASFAGQLVLTMCTFKDETERLKWLDKELEEEKKAKMLDLIHRINKVVGAITDASRLRISEVGNLNGIIIGEKGTAKVETIGAGGWNVQCFHYRTLVNKVKSPA